MRFIQFSKGTNDMTFANAPIYVMQAVMAVIVVSPTIAGFAARVALAAPLYWLGLIDDGSVAAFANWTAF
jgi:hypothetical protein